MTFLARAEREPGPEWRSFFEACAPAYRAWYLSDGDAARPDLGTCRRMLARHMPELVPVHQRLVELAGADALDARMLSLYNPPAFVSGCSQVAWTRDAPILVRNYDYPPSRLEGLLVLTEWGKRQVLGMSDCLWGLLDGINDAGLALSLTFGGSVARGEGFAVPLVLRYILEVCDTVKQACEILARVPIHTSQNVTLLDRRGDFMTAYIAPEGPTRFQRTRVSTNHQETVQWPAYERAVHSLAREAFLTRLLAEPGLTLDGLLAAFLAAPLYSPSHLTGSGTLYTAAYFPAEGRVELLWPHERWSESFDCFQELARTETYHQQAA
ncbi:MAG: C45 family autoproteolytic acyltransferase/hydolase [Solirubrobacteraceae bacterium]